MYAKSFDFAAATHMTQDGDPMKLVLTTMNSVNGESMANGRDVPLELLLGTDTVEQVDERVKAAQKMLDEWTNVRESMGFNEDTKLSGDDYSLLTHFKEPEAKIKEQQV